MRYAIISDIHANKNALHTALSMCKELGIDKIVCLGDIVGYGFHPNECCQLLIDNNIQSVVGNNDLAVCGAFEPVYYSFKDRHTLLWTRSILNERHKLYLKSLPETQVIDGAFVIVHDALQEYSTYLLDEVSINKTFDLLKKNYDKLKLCFSGHTHKASIFELQADRIIQVNTSGFNLKPDSLYLVNPGSTGYQRDAKSPFSFAIYDSIYKAIQIVQLEDIEKQQLYKIHMRPNININAALVKQYILFIMKAGKRFVLNRIKRFRNNMYNMLKDLRVKMTQLKI